MLQLARGGQQRKPHIDPARRAKMSRRGKRHPALHIAVIDTRQIYRRSLSRDSAFNGFSARLHAAHAQPLASGKQLDFIFRADASRNQRARHHRSKPFHRKRPVDGQAGSIAPHLFQEFR